MKFQLKETGIRAELYHPFEIQAVPKMYPITYKSTLPLFRNCTIQTERSE